MQALTLDYVESAKSKTVPLLVFAIAAIFTGYLLDTYADIRNEKSSLQSQSSQLQRQQKIDKKGNANTEEATRLKPELARVSEVTRRLTLPWNGLFRAVEAANFADVALLSMQPDAGKQTVTVTAEAKDMNSMLEYVNRLAKEPLLVDAHLTSHQMRKSRYVLW